MKSDKFGFQRLRKDGLKEIWKDKISGVDVVVYDPYEVEDMITYICMGKKIDETDIGADIKDWEMINLYNVFQYVYGIEIGLLD